MEGLEDKHVTPLAALGLKIKIQLILECLAQINLGTLELGK